MTNKKTPASIPGAVDLLPASQGATTSTRDVIAHLLLHRPLAASDIAAQLDLTPQGVRRHLDQMVSEGMAACSQPSPYQDRGRGRPAKTYYLTELGRASFGHSYDQLALAALRTVRKLGGEQALSDFATARMNAVVSHIAPLRENADRTELATQAQRIATAFNNSGFATTVENAHGGVQICQHHCPVAHVAHEFPSLCRAEAQVLSELLNTPLQRLSTIAHGDHTCTTNISVTHQGFSSSDPESEAS